MNVKSLFIVWAHHSRRAETLATELNGQVSFQYEARLKGGWLIPLRYLVQGWKTWHLLEREQPEVVLVQSPPIFAPLVVTLWCELRGKTRSTKHRSSFAIDCHPSTFYSREWRWTLPLLRFLTRRANVTLSSNMEAQNILQSWNARGFFLADGVPSLSLPTGTETRECHSDWFLTRRRLYCATQKCTWHSYPDQSAKRFELWCL